MKKLLAIFAAIMLVAQPSFAAVATLSDEQLNNVAAGDWVVTTLSEEAVDVYHTNNTLDLQDDSQTHLQAVSNANAVDSAVNVATNIASLTGSEPSTNQSVNGYNEADILNAKPSSEWSDESESASWESSSSSWFGSFSLGAASNYDAEYSASYGAVETLDEVTTIDISAASAFAYSKDCKGCEEELLAVSVLVSDYDKIVDYDKLEVAGARLTEHRDASLTISASALKEESSHRHSKESRSSSYRRNLSQNNHLKSKDNAQQWLQAVSNLNAVASGAAVQTNIASNVGVSGTINHANIASVVSGL